jgi:hypothetical protein
MGNEFLYPLGVALGLALFAWLLFRSFFARSRPYALPTLVAAVVFALVQNDRPSPGYFWHYLVDWFCLGAIFFGLHAHAIQWLTSRVVKRDAS